MDTAHTKKSKLQQKKTTKLSTESSSNGANLKDKSMFNVDVEVMELLEGHLAGQAPAPAAPAGEKPQLSTSALAKQQNDDLCKFCTDSTQNSLFMFMIKLKRTFYFSLQTLFHM